MPKMSAATRGGGGKIKCKVRRAKFSHDGRPLYDKNNQVVTDWTTLSLSKDVLRLWVKVTAPADRENWQELVRALAKRAFASDLEIARQGGIQLSASQLIERFMLDEIEERWSDLRRDRAVARAGAEQNLRGNEQGHIYISRKFKTWGPLLEQLGQALESKQTLEFDFGQVSDLMDALYKLDLELVGEDAMDAMGLQPAPRRQPVVNSLASGRLWLHPTQTMPK
jgi:hypothetical protein